MNYTNRTQNIDIYFKEIRSFSNITTTEEKELFARVKSGDAKAQDEIFNKMAKLAVAVAKSYTGNPDLLPDLIQEANIGILLAIPKFDISLGHRFSSYARWWMIAQIGRYLDEQGVVHGNNPKVMSKIKKLQSEFWKKNGREMTEFELFETLEEMGEKVTDLTALTQISIQSINQELDDDDFTVEDSREFNERTASVQEETNENPDNLSDEMTRMLAKLDEREKRFVMMNFGIGYDYEMDFGVIAEKENERMARNAKPGEKVKTITNERVRQIVKAAIVKMQN